MAREHKDDTTKGLIGEGFPRSLPTLVKEVSISPNKSITLKRSTPSLQNSPYNLLTFSTKLFSQQILYKYYFK